MKITALTFTCRRDAEKAALTAQLLPATWRRVWCVSAADADMPVPEGTEKLVADFDRGKNLIGEAAVAGMRDVYLRFADDVETDALIKLDSDTALWRPEAFSAPLEFAGVDFVYVRRYFVEGRLTANGCCYAMSKRALHRLRTLDAKKECAGKLGAEDVVFSSFITVKNVDLVYCQLDKARCHWSVAPFVSRSALLSHLGYYSTDEARGILREMCALLGRVEPNADAFAKKLEAFQNERGSKKA